MIGAIIAIILFMLMVYLDLWNKIGDTERTLLGIALALLFFMDEITIRIKK